MGTSTILILVTIVCYLGMMIAIGAKFSKKNKDTSDFYLGGRKTDFRLHFCFAKLLTLCIIKVNLVSTLV